MVALDVVVGRQPIFDRKRSILGYELVFHTLDPVGEAPVDPGDYLTAELIFNSVSIGIDRLVGSKILFCNASRGVLTGTMPIPLPPERTVIEVSDSILPKDDVLAGCRRLQEQGFGLALDGVTWWADVEYSNLSVTYVKVDIQSASLPDLTYLVEECHRRDIGVIGEKIDSIDEFQWCNSLGFDLLQGHFLAQPSIVPGRVLTPGDLTRLHLAARLLDHECPISELEEIIRRDPVMTLQLLKLASVGAANGMRRTIRTIREALVLVGWRRFQSWISLLLVANKGHDSEEELTNALTRARMSELLAQRSIPSVADSAFLVGMLSSFDVLLDVSIEDIVVDLALDDDIRAALVAGEGPLGLLVSDVKDFLLGRADQAIRSGLGDAELSAAAFESLVWSVDVTAEISAAK